jgi:cell division protein FtsB
MVSPPRAPLAGSATRRRTQLTTRAAVLALVAGALLVALVYPVRTYLSQRGRIDELHRQTEAQRVSVENLKEQKERWGDPAYVRAQARRRLHFVMPGETGYVTIGPDGNGDGEPAVGDAQRDRQTWFNRLVDSVGGAVEPPEGGAPR